MEEHEIVAGRFSTWIAVTIRSHATRDGVEVPCGGCTACCRSSYFIHIEPEETETLRRIPKALRYPAPDRPRGHVVLGYDERGHCPMLVDDRCSIYEDRPRACRQFDCRVFVAAGISPDEDGKAAIAERTRTWRFEETGADRDQHAAVEAAARYLRDHPDCFPAGAAPSTAHALALAAVRVHRVFLHREEPSAEDVRAELLTE